jgi:membrane-bound lytic murein transglycosylase D
VTHPRVYTARKGETLVTISDRFGVSLNQLRRWNRITGFKVQSGQRIYVADPATVSRATTRAHRASGPQAGAGPRQSAPAKSVAKHSAPHAAPGKSNTPTAKKAPVNHPAASAAAKKNGTASARKSLAKKSAAPAKARAKK